MGSKLRSTKMFLQTGTLTTWKPALDYLIGQPQASGSQLGYRVIDEIMPGASSAMRYNSGR
jgi:hypothetical protein